jgi:hypothetical protein
VLLPLLALAVYLASPLKVHSDTIWAIPTAISLLREGNADLDEYAPTVARRQRYGIVEAGGHLYNSFPLGPSLPAAALLALFNGLVDALEPLARHLPPARVALERWQRHYEATGDIDVHFFDTTEQLVASLLVSLAVLFVFLAARRQAPPLPAAVLALLFALGTSAYSTASRLLWQHSPSLLCLAVVVYLLSGPRLRAGQALALGVTVALSYVFRPTNALTVLAVTGFLLLLQRRSLPAYLLGAALVALPFCLHNWSTYGALLPPYYLPGRLEPGEGHLGEALVGNLVSPGRGLLVYSPIALLALLSFARRAWRRELQAHEVLFAGVLGAHWVAISSFPHWWAGHAFGPRFFTDVTPYWVAFLLPPVQRACAAPRQWRAGTLALLVAGALSLFIHVRGSTARATWAWNGEPVDVDRAPERLWDWGDLAFLRR